MSKKPVYLPGGNPSGTFTEAARVIAKRAMPYIGKYNQFYDKNSRPYKSIARGLSRDLGIPIDEHDLFFAHGVKESMMYSASFIDWLCRDLQRLIRKAGSEPPKFKFLIRTPSYRPILEQFKGFASFECRLVSCYQQNGGNGDGHLHHFNLLKELERDNFMLDKGRSEKFEYTIGFLDINPCNPSGHIRSAAETKDTAYLLALANIMNSSYLEFILGDQISFKVPPFVVVEDHIYRGLEYAGHKTVSFCQINEKLRECAHTIFGVAKYGLVGMRGSVTIAPKFAADMMSHWFKQRNSDISPFSVLSCEYMFGDNKEDIASRTKYLAKKTNEYERNALISTAIIDGKARDFLSPAEYETATSWLVKHGKLSEDAAHKLLEDGIRGIKVVNLPRAGFFLLLNFDGLIELADDETLYNAGPPIAAFIRQVAYHRLSMNIGNSGYMALRDEFDTVIRFTVAEPPAQLTENLMRLRELGELMKSIGPLNSEKIPDPRNPFSAPSTLRKSDQPRINWSGFNATFE